MDSTSAAEDFPDLYRAILDGIADLERAGLRDDAYRVRRAAIDAYSSAWGEPGRRRLQLLLGRLHRAVASPHPTPPDRRRAGMALPKA